MTLESRISHFILRNLVYFHWQIFKSRKHLIFYIFTFVLRVFSLFYLVCNAKKEIKLYLSLIACRIDLNLKVLCNFSAFVGFNYKSQLWLANRFIPNMDAFEINDDGN